MAFFVKPLSALFSKAKEGSEYSILLWFRKKYNLSPKDPRFLEMTYEEIQEDWLVDKLHEDPSVTLKDLEYDTSSDEEWMKTMERHLEQEELRKVFSKPKPKEEFVEVERETR